MSANALDRQAKGKKHCNITKKRSAGLHCSFFRKEEKPAVRTAEKDSKEICKDGKTLKGELDDYLLDDSISQIAAKTKFGKTKCSYFINYGLASYIKE